MTSTSESIELQKATDATYEEDNLSPRPFSRTLEGWCRTSRYLASKDRSFTYDEYLDGLFYRDRLERIGARLTSEGARTAWSASIAACDDVFIEMTRNGLVPLVPHRLGWWWHRVPIELSPAFAAVLRAHGVIR